MRALIGSSKISVQYHKFTMAPSSDRISLPIEKPKVGEDQDIITMSSCKVTATSAKEWSPLSAIPSPQSAHLPLVTEQFVG